MQDYTLACIQSVDWTTGQNACLFFCQYIGVALGQVGQAFARPILCETTPTQQELYNHHVLKWVWLWCGFLYTFA